MFFGRNFDRISRVTLDQQLNKSEKELCCFQNEYVFTKCPIPRCKVCDVIAKCLKYSRRTPRMDNVVKESFFNFIFLNKARVQVA